MPERWANRVATTLALPANAADLTLTLASSVGLPVLGAADHAWGVIEGGPAGEPTAYEIVRVSAIAGAVLTVTRSEQGTTAPATWDAGARFELRLTAQTLRDLQTGLDQLLQPIRGYVGCSVAVSSNDPWGDVPTVQSGTETNPTLGAGTEAPPLAYVARVRYVGIGSNGRRGTGQTRFWRGDAVGRGGFNYDLRFGAGNTADGVLANTRLFMGYVDLDAFLCAAGEISAATARAMIGVGFDAAEPTNGNYRLFHNAGGGAVTVVDTGFPRVVGGIYRLRISALSNASDLAVILDRQDTGVRETWTLSTNIPGSTTLLYPQFAIEGTGGAPSAQLDVINFRGF